MKTYITRTMKVDKKTWQPEYNYTETKYEDVTYCYDTTKPLRIAYVLVTYALIIFLFSTCVVVGSHFQLSDWQAILWIAPFGVAFLCALIFMIELCDAYSSVDDNNEREARNKTKKEFELQYQLKSQEVDEWRSKHPKEELARKFVESIISFDTLLERCKKYDTKTQYEIFQLVDRYKTHRGKVKK